MAILTYQQHDEMWEYLQPPGFYWSLLNSNPAFWRAFRFVQLPKENVKGTPYGLDADLQGTVTLTEIPPFSPPAPYPVSSLPVIPYDDRVTSVAARFRAAVRHQAWADVYQPDTEDFRTHRIMADFDSRLENWGRALITSIIARTATPAASDVGSLQATLAGYNNTTDALIQGYNAAVTTKQTVVVSGRLFQADLAGGTLTISSMEPWFRAFNRMNGGYADAVIMPERAYVRLMDSWNNRSGYSPFMPIQEGSRLFEYVPREKGAGDIMSIRGAAVVVVPDDLYTAAGHTVVGAVGAADYDIYLIRIASSSYLDGVCLGYVPLIEETEMMKPVQTQFGQAMTVFPGMYITKQNMIASDAGIVAASPKMLTSFLQLVATKPDFITVLSGVTD